MWFRNFKILNEVINVFVRPQDVVQIPLLYTGNHIKNHVEFVDKPYLLFVHMILLDLILCFSDFGSLMQAHISGGGTGAEGRP